MDTSAVERRQQANAGATELGAAHDLGECRGVYEQGPGHLGRWHRDRRRAGYGRPAIVHLRDAVEETVVALRLPTAIGQYDSGVPVRFGHLSVSRDGIAWNSGAKHAGLGADPRLRGTSAPASCLYRPAHRASDMADRRA